MYLDIIYIDNIIIRSTLWSIS